MTTQAQKLCMERDIESLKQNNREIKVNFQFSGLIGDREYPVYQMEDFTGETASVAQFKLELKR